MIEQQLVAAFFHALPDGKTRYPMQMEINKMGKNIELVIKLTLKSEQELINIKL